MKLKFTFFVVFLCGTIIAQNDIEIKNFINKNKTAVEFIHQHIIANKVGTHDVQFKNIVKKQLLTVANYSSDSQDAFKQAIELRLICNDMIAKDFKLINHDLELNQKEISYQSFYSSYSIKNHIKLPKETIIFVNAINSTDSEALNKFTLNIK